jgi:hypothetical protein
MARHDTTPRGPPDGDPRGPGPAPGPAGHPRRCAVNGGRPAWACGKNLQVAGAGAGEDDDESKEGEGTEETRCCCCMHLAVADMPRPDSHMRCGGWADVSRPGQCGTAMFLCAGGGDEWCARARPPKSARSGDFPCRFSGELARLPRHLPTL